MASRRTDARTTFKTKPEFKKTPTSTLNAGITNIFNRAAMTVGIRTARHSIHADNDDGFSERVLQHHDLQDDDDQISNHWLIDSLPFQATVLVCICLNTIQIGLEADHPEVEVLWLFCEHLFTVIFFVEICIKVYILRLVFVEDNWNIFDAVLVALAIIDTWIFALIADVAGADLQLFSIFRIFRMLRLLRVVRLVRVLRPLAAVMAGIVEAINATFWVAGVMALTIYVGAVFCVQFLNFQDREKYPGYTKDLDVILEMEFMSEFNPHLAFGDVPKAMVTLFNIAIMAEWPEVVRPIMLNQPEMMLFFISFVMLVTFGVMNVIIAMIVDRVLDNARQMKKYERQQERHSKLRTLKRIQELVSHIDINGDGFVLLPEIIHNMEDASSPLLELLSNVDLPKGTSAEELFYMLDSDGDGAVAYGEFVQAFYRLIDGGPFQHICILQGGINALKAMVNKSFHRNEERLDDIERLLVGMNGDAHHYPSNNAKLRRSGPIEERDQLKIMSLLNKDGPFRVRGAERGTDHGTDAPWPRLSEARARDSTMTSADSISLQTAAAKRRELTEDMRARGTLSPPTSPATATPSSMPQSKSGSAARSSAIRAREDTEASGGTESGDMLAAERRASLTSNGESRRSSLASVDATIHEETARDGELHEAFLHHSERSAGSKADGHSSEDAAAAALTTAPLALQHLEMEFRTLSAKISAARTELEVVLQREMRLLMGMSFAGLQRACEQCERALQGTEAQGHPPLSAQKPDAARLSVHSPREAPPIPHKDPQTALVVGTAANHASCMDHDTQLVVSPRNLLVSEAAVCFVAHEARLLRMRSTSALHVARQRQVSGGSAINGTQDWLSQGAPDALQPSSQEV